MELKKYHECVVGNYYYLRMFYKDKEVIRVRDKKTKEVILMYYIVDKSIAEINTTGRNVIDINWTVEILKERGII